MTRNKDVLVFNTTAAKHSTLAMEVDVARRYGFSGLETTAKKVSDFLAAGYTVSELQSLLNEMPVYGIGTILDIERHGNDHQNLLKEASAIFEIAHKCGAKAVQVINGPLNFQAVVDFHQKGHSQHYVGVLGLPEDEQLTITSRNLATLADMAKDYGLVIYLEALAWSPLNTLRQQQELLRRADRSNLKMVVDYWHCYTSGDRPEDVARLNKDDIYGVHVCDALLYNGGVPNEVVLRDIPTGQGVLNLREWTDAVKSTGYDFWWSSETFCQKEYQANIYAVASQLKPQLEKLVL